MPSGKSLKDYDEFVELSKYTLLNEFLEMGSYEVVAIMSGFISV